MKKNKKLVTVFLIIMTAVLLGSTIYISTLLSSSSSPTQIQKTKAANITYTRKVDLFPTAIIDQPTETGNPIPTPTTTRAQATDVTVTASPVPSPTKTQTLLAQAIVPSPTTAVVSPTGVQPTTAALATVSPTKAVSAQTSTGVPTNTPTPTLPIPTPTSIILSPTPQLLAYRSTSPTMTPNGTGGGVNSPSVTLSPTKKAQPTGVQQLPDTGWVQTSSILFIVATSTILFSLLF